MGKHILGYRFSDGKRIRFAQQFTEEELAALLNTSELPDGWLTWQVEGQGTPPLIARIPVIYSALGEPVDPIPLLDLELFDPYD